MSGASFDQYLRHYPFLELASEALEESDWSLNSMFEEPVRERAKNRVVSAINELEKGEVSSDQKTEVLSYPLSRILVSLLDDDDIIQRYAEAEARSARVKMTSDIERDSDPFESDSIYGSRDKINLNDINENFDINIELLEGEDLFESAKVADVWRDLSDGKRANLVNEAFRLKGEFGESSVSNVSWAGMYPRIVSNSDFSFDGKQYFSLDVSDYIRLSGDGPEWSLTNRPVADGKVILEYEDLFELIENAVRESILEELPVEVPNDISDKLDSDIAEVINRIDDEYLDTVDVRGFPLLNNEMLPRQHALGQQDFEKFSPIGAREVEISLSEVRDHYARGESVYTELGTLGDMHTSWLGKEEHTGWYVSGNLDSREENSKAWDNNFAKWSRMSILPDDFDPSEAGRAVYTTNTYSPRENIKKRYYKIEDSERVWMDEALEDEEEVKRLPDYDELGAYSLIVDIDLENEWKSRPLPDEYQRIVEGRLQAWVGAFAEFLGGDVEDVFAVDSGGGAYVMTPPAATKPLREEFEGGELYMINNAIQTRMRELTTILDDLITGLDDAPDDLFSADAVQNKNRQWKTLLSLHSDLDAVVHPIDPTDVDYDEVSFDELEDRHYEDALVWAKEFTSDDYSNHIETIVRSLFQTEAFEKAGSRYDTYEGDDWKEILENFIEEKEKQAQTRQEVRERLEEGSIGNVGVTTDKVDIDAAIAQADLKSYLKAHHVQKWDTDNRSDGTISFSPNTWRNPSPEANSCFYGPSGGNDGSPVFVDRKEGWTAGIIDLVAYDEGITNHPSETPTGADWWEAVDALREMGEEIPVQIPDITEDDYEYDKLGQEYIVKAAQALDVVDENDIETRDGKYGEFRTIKSNKKWNQTLELLEERNIKHGRDRRQVSNDNSDEEDDEESEK